MTSVTIKRKRLTILPVLMTFFTAKRRMLTGERETGFAMIEDGRFPAIHSVTKRTIMIKLSGDVIRIGYALIFLLVT